MAVNPKTLRARYHNGMLEPLEQVDLPEDAEVRLTIESAPDGRTEQAPPKRIEFLVRRGTVLTPLTREEIYEDAI